MRSAVVVLAIVALVVCPHDCAAKSVVLQASPTAAAPVCCGHCQHAPLPVDTLPTKRPESEPIPAGPQPSEDGKSCLCEGAIFDVATRGEVDAAVGLAFLACPSDIAITPSLASRISRVRGRGALPLMPVGRLARIALRSLQL